ncbi:di-heme oxidoredictase family protein [Singulisphaera sp. PoT]|uniref:di-heme oxidoredictase family protein n=1 Tax=Singulisphaera sp. PoT TaxID=3411797 RepID=UPI003BF50C22
MLHRYGTDPAYNHWRGTVPGQHGAIQVRISQRNPTPLFGVGLIDAIPDEAIEAIARKKLPSSTGIKGRVSRLKDGRIGRFGWKAQTATLKEFVMSAASGEMGLELPEQHQAGDPRFPGRGANGLDMDANECFALVTFVKELPAPGAINPADDHEAVQIKAGADIFKTIGCGHCHTPNLGGAEGIYSDLLLHDMSPVLEDVGSYNVFVENQPNAGNEAGDPSSVGAAGFREWRTPPLWGLRDSGPYLHDGRASSIEQAITLHAGQGATSARRYADLSPRRKRQLKAFLKSLAAPTRQR